MDIKAPAEKYAEITGQKAGFDKVKKSVKLIINSGLPYEFRSTLLPSLHSADDVIAMAKLIKSAAKYYLQKFVPTGDLIDKSFKKEKGKSKCCFCDPHKNCWFKQVDIKKSYPQLYPKIAGH